MATRQYIGARYVPKFYTNSNDGSTQWQPNVVYEPLIYVTLQNGNMYISKKEVPATVGSPAENIDYWLDVGNYNGWVESLQGQIDNINDTTIPAIQSQINVINDTTIPAIQGRINVIEENEIWFGRNKKVICIGDSYLNGDETSSWGANLRALLANGSNTIIKGYGGTGFIGQLPDHTFQIQLSEVVASMTTEQRKSITDIVVVGGLNDKYGYYQVPAQTDNDLKTAISNFVAYAHTNFPNAVVRIGVAGWATDGLSDKQYWHNILNCYKTCASGDAPSRIQYMSGLEYIMPTIPNSGYVDTVHPNINTSKLIAQGIVNCMMGGYGNCGIDYFEKNTGVNWWNGTSNQNGEVKLTIYGNIGTLKIDRLQWDYDPHTSYTFNTEYNFAVLQSNAPVRASTGIRIPATFWVDDGSGDPKLMSGYIAIKQSVMSFYLNSAIAGVTNISRIWATCSNYSDSIFNIC